MSPNGQVAAELTGQQIKALRDALISAFPSDNALTDLLLYGLNVRINTIIPAGALNDRVREVIIWAQSKGRTDELVAAALNENAGHAALRRVAELLALDDGAGQFERIVRKDFPPADVESWRNRMIQSEQAVCRVELPRRTGIGTGFLVGPDLLITNYHVMQEVIEKTASPGQIVCRFDYRKKGAEIVKGVEYRLADNWRVDDSPENELDFALVRLGSRAGDEPLGGQPNAPTRGWLSPSDHSFAVGDPVLIIQHPNAAPQKFAIGKVTADPPPANRVVYDANTDEGSSGSPCFTDDWRLTALHHWGGEKHNRGVVLKAIVTRLKNKGVQLGG